MDRADELGVFPAVATRVMRIADSPTSSILDLEAAVSSDPTLSGQVLKVANSGFFGLKRQVSSVQDALLILGFDSTRDLAVAVSLASLGRSAKRGRRALWQHSLRTSVVAQQVAERIPNLRARDVFVVGLMHDLGKLILLELDEERYAPLLPLSDAELLQGEREAFGFDHAALGAACLERWSLPDRMVHAVRGHHDVPFEGRGLGREEGALEAAAVGTANALVHVFEEVKGDQGKIEAALREARPAVRWLDALGLSQGVGELAAQLAEVDAHVASLQLS